MKFVQKHQKLTQVGLIIFQIQNNLAKISQRLWNFCQSGEISPNLFTLLSKARLANIK